MQQNLFRLVALAAAILACGTVRASEEPADTAAKPRSFLDHVDPAIVATMRRQEQLQPAVTALYEAHLQSPGSGFAGVAFEGDGVTLYWKGPLSLDMYKAVGQARKVGAVAIKPAAYSLAELEAAAAKIDERAHVLGGSEIQAVVMRYDGAGLDVELMPRATLKERAAARAKAGAIGIASAEQVLAGLDLGVPITLAIADAPIELASRTNDSPAWNAGGYWESRRSGQVRGLCTTGFGIRAYNRTWVLTAAHCATAPDVGYQGFDGQYMGPVTRENYSYDLILIDAGGYHRMFDNVQPNGNDYKNVYGWGYHSANELLCQSGFTSGYYYSTVICGLKTGSSQNISVSCSTPDSDGDCGYTIYGVIKTTQINGSTAVRGGDSGGPVFSLMGDGVRAKGSVTGGSGTTMYFQDWADVIRLYSGYPVTP
ncbi:S1 family peptidase [Tahibacter caeni]|uniref:S1 family peptidase n=1 Tax=Tahibacter caeni TaxID=1453545 RepID=UPI002147975D|nr:S1 family peptidase [Tahibacter caeni]